MEEQQQQQLNQNQNQNQQALVPYKPRIQDGGGQSQPCFDNSSEQSRDVDLMSVDQCNIDDSQLVGATPAATEDASKAAVELLMMMTKTTTQNKVEPSPLPVVPDTTTIPTTTTTTMTTVVVAKRKRGRPPRGQPKMAITSPPPRKKKDEEDVCFICFDGGSLVLCDRRSVYSSSLIFLFCFVFVVASLFRA